MPRPWPTTPPTAAQRGAYADAAPHSYWLDTVAAREPLPQLGRDESADLVVIGGGFTGLWAALHAKTDRPGRDVILLEAGELGGAASTRNGGFCVASLTHGLGNGMARFGDEMPALERLGLENYAGLLADLTTHGIDCALEETGEMTVALEEHQLPWLEEEAEMLRRFGHEVQLMTGEELRSDIASPTFKGAVWDRTGAAILNPAQLVDGLRRAVLASGVRVFEHSAVAGVEQTSVGLRIHVGGDATNPHWSTSRTLVSESAAPAAMVSAKRAILATGAHRSLVRGARRRIAPVYDYVLMTEPLTSAQLESIGWHRRQGIGDSANQFHYYRLTSDGRILWGGYDAVYRFGGPVAPRHDQHDASFARLSQHFSTTFPQLEGVRFTHRWGGAIDTCSRFSVFFGLTHGGRVAHAAGYTGLGVCATRFGGRTALDLVDGRDTTATRLSYVRSRPTAFPPEPVCTAAIKYTQRQLEAADAHEGRRGLWLRTLDRMGLGFDS